MDAQHTRKSWLQAVILAGVLVAAVLVGGGLALVFTGHHNTLSSSTGQAAAVSGAPLAVSGLKQAPGGSSANGVAAFPNLPDLVDRVRPSVVAINTVISATNGTNQGQGLGTGIVIDTKGDILTNYHVIDGASSITVKFADGSLVPGQVIGSDPGNDLAIVKVTGVNDLSPATFANSDQVRVGQAVFAIGNPFSLEFTVTSGVVSGLDRESEGGITGRPVRGVIQTDAAVNPGNSGGPLFDASGNVIGINASIENPTGQRVFVGVGFAIPANTAERFVPAMIAGKPITHPQLGVAGVTLNAVNAKEAGVTEQKGVYVTTVTPDSAAAAAGLHAAAAATDSGALPPGGDVILAVNGQSMNTIEQLARVIDGFNVGDNVKLTIARAGKQIDVSTTLKEWTGS